MKNKNVNIILLSGGSGTRLWPLSNEVRSKQFLKIFRNELGEHESMIQRTFRMICDTNKNAKVTIATSQIQVNSIKNQLGNNVEICIEPCRRDTFPAIVLAVAYLHDVKGVSENESIIVCPVDPLVEKEYFKIFKKLYDSTEYAKLCLMGIEPTYPSEKYGYIVPKNKIVEFKEKPTEEKAKEFIKQGALWNGGVFAFKVSYLLEKAKKICGISSYKELFDNYSDLKKISFDYAVAEKETNIKVIKYSGEWKDLGTWNTFTEAMKDPTGGNVVLGENCDNVHVVNELSLPIVALGLKDVVVAATPDGILVSDKTASAKLKEYVPKNRPMFEKRDWGEYRVLYFQQFDNGIKSLTKELMIIPGRSISYQKHEHRSETWTIVRGRGQLLINDTVREVKAGDSVIIKKEDRYSIKAIDELHIIEVQIGDELVEEDIERFDWDWK